MKRIPVYQLVLCAGALAVLGAQAQTPRYSFSADGAEVIDNKTGLIWRRCAEGQSWDGATCVGAPSVHTPRAAMALARQQAAASGVAWRLPNIKELSAIADWTKINPAVDRAVFPGATRDWFWSASPVADDAGYVWRLKFDEGNVSTGSHDWSNAVRLVRDRR